MNADVEVDIGENAEYAAMADAARAAREGGRGGEGRGGEGLGGGRSGGERLPDGFGGKGRALSAPSTGMAAAPPAPPTPPTPSAAAESSLPPEPPSGVGCRVLIRHLSGETSERRFLTDTSTVSDLYAFATLTSPSPSPSSPFVLVEPHPRRVIRREEGGRTMEDVRLGGKGVRLVCEREGGG